MSGVFRRGWVGWLAVATVLVVSGTACGEDPLAPDVGIEALVGDWEATSLTLTNVANPTVRPDLIELGATFDLNVQPSGQYTAILVFNLQSSTEIGQISVSGGEVTLRPSFPPGQPATTGTYSVTPTTLIIDGSTRFDFNLDGTPEPALAHFEMVRK